MNNLNETASNGGLKLFYAIWDKVQERFYDQERLVALNWAAQKHRFDAEIVDQASALHCAGLLLAMLNDKYTRLLEPQEVVAKREGRVSDERFAYNKMLPGKIGYIGISSFDHSAIVEQVQERIEDLGECDAYVVDVRGNGGGLINETANVCELFIDEGHIAFTENRTKSGVTETFVFFSHEYFQIYIEATGREPEKNLHPRRPALVAGKRMVLLIDGDTASSAELFGAALLESGHEKGTVIAMGAKTCGKGISQADFDILDIVTVKISCGRFFSPQNKWFGDAAQTVSNGIEPDICLEDNGDYKHAVHVAAEHLRFQLRKDAAGQEEHVQYPERVA